LKKNLSSNNFEVTIFTDGACIGNPGPGGFAAVLLSGDRRKEISGGFRLTTNNRMEILAVVEALRAINKKKRFKIKLYSDSSLVVNSINKRWIHSWQQNDWKKSDKKPVLNKDLWIQLMDELKHHEVVFEWVKAHAGIKENERCDELSKFEASKDSLPDDVGYISGNKSTV